MRYVLTINDSSHYPQPRFHYVQGGMVQCHLISRQEDRPQTFHILKFVTESSVGAEGKSVVSSQGHAEYLWEQFGPLLYLNIHTVPAVCTLKYK